MENIKYDIFKTTQTEVDTVGEDRLTAQIYEGIQSETFNTYVAQSATPSQILLNIQPSSGGEMISSTPYVEVQMAWTFSTGAGGANISPADVEINQSPSANTKIGLSAVDSLPFHRMVSNWNDKLGGASFNYDFKNALNPILDNIIQDDDRRVGGFTNMEPRVWLEDATAANFTGYNSYLNKYTRNGSIDMWTITQGATATQLTVALTTYEPLLHGVWRGVKRSAGLKFVNELVQNITLDNTARPFYVESAIANFTVSTLQSINYTLHLPTFTPNPSVIVPSVQVKEYLDYQHFSQGTQVGAAVSQAYKLTVVPKSVYLYVDCDPPAGSSVRMKVPITSLNIQFNNRNGILSNCNLVDLVNKSLNNGLNSNYVLYQAKAIGVDVISHLVGAPLKLNFGKDIPLDLTQAVGAPINQNFSFSFTSQVLNGVVAANPMLHVVFEYSNRLLITPSYTQTSPVYLSPSQVVKALETEGKQEAGGMVRSGGMVSSGGAKSKYSDLMKHLKR